MPRSLKSMLLLALVACGESHPCTLSTAAYDRTCSVDDDCVLVFEGNVCKDECWCANSAISIGAEAQYNLDQVERHTPHPGSCNCPTVASPSCVGSVCTVPAPSAAPK